MVVGPQPLSHLPFTSWPLGKQLALLCAPNLPYYVPNTHTVPNSMYWLHVGSKQHSQQSGGSPSSLATSSLLVGSIPSLSPAETFFFSFLVRPPYIFMSPFVCDPVNLIRVACPSVPRELFIGANAIHLSAGIPLKKNDLLLP